MNAEQWQRVRALFELALEREPADLAAFLAREAPEDPALRAEVQSLLDHHTRAGAFLQEPVASRVPAWFDDDEDGGLTPGSLIGPYAIVRELGRGGMGRVYLASDTRLGRTVALKALPPAWTRDPGHRERLKREARAAAALTHPGICTVYALEEVGDALFIATEFVDGRTLREEISARVRPSPRLIEATVRELAAALASAHQKGIVHRDLKPENVMRTKDGHLKILDFGLARINASGEDAPATFATRPGALMGTPAYMSPEQLNGQAADARADVFALGLIAYEFTCGDHPFAAPTELGLIARVLESHARPLAARCPQVPLPVAAVIDRCLAKAPDSRFATAAEVLAALDNGSTPVASPGVSLWWRTHQLALMGVYIVASTIAWQIKESYPSRAALWIFVAIGVGSAVSGILRGHFVFTEQMNRPRLADERKRTATIVTVVDILIALALVADGFTFVEVRPLWAMLTMALGLGIAMAALVMEPATTVAAFGADPPSRSGR
jgi:hypothetical protein